MSPVEMVWVGIPPTGDAPLSAPGRLAHRKGSLECFYSVGLQGASAILRVFQHCLWEGSAPDFGKSLPLLSHPLVTDSLPPGRHGVVREEATVGATGSPAGPLFCEWAGCGFWVAVSCAVLLNTLPPSCLPCPQEPGRSHSIDGQTLDIQLAGPSGQ